MARTHISNSSFSFGSTREVNSPPLPYGVADIARSTPDPALPAEVAPTEAKTPTMDIRGVIGVLQVCSQ